MPTIVPGYLTEQKTLTVASDDASMNAAITAEASDGWLVELMVLSGANMVILFTRTAPIALA